MKSAARLVCVLILLLLMNSCTNTIAQPTAQAIDNTWLQNSVCELPCWQQIMPQETSFDEAMSVLQESQIPVTFWNENYIEFQYQGDILGTIQSSTNGLVNVIILDVRTRNIALNDIIQILGEPEKAHVGKALYGDVCNGLIVFQERGVLLNLLPLVDHSDYFSEAADCQVDITISSQVYRIVLVGDINDSEFWKNASYSGLDYVDWKGYGTYP
jgi:hypothetical protein